LNLKKGIVFLPCENNIMKRNLLAILSILTVTILASCSGAYNANPSTSGANYSANPLNPPKFDWASQGTAPLSCDINGSHFVASDSLTTFAFNSTNGNVILGGNSGGTYIELIMQVAYSGNQYSMGYHNFTYCSAVYDSYGNPNPVYNYFSYLGNVGGFDVTENDSARISGMFYFQGINVYGTVINISNGYFNIAK